jgi:hypothetical protein
MVQAGEKSEPYDISYVESAIAGEYNVIRFSIKDNYMGTDKKPHPFYPRVTVFESIEDFPLIPCEKGVGQKVRLLSVTNVNLYLSYDRENKYVIPRMSLAAKCEIIG